MDGATRKITVEVPEKLLQNAQEATGAGITRTVTEGLRHLASVRAQRELRKLRGKIKGLNLDDMRYDRE
jgi:hypothetical protein